MRFRVPGAAKEEPELNLTSLIDVVLVLIIFFVLTTTFVHQNRLRVDLPQAASGQAASSRTPTVSVDAQGHYAVGGRRLPHDSEQALAGALKALVPSGRGHAKLLIRADGRASHQSVVTVMDVAAQLGFQHIAMATERRP